MTTIRIVLALDAHHQWLGFQMDIESTFLNGELHQEVYVYQPPRFEIPSKEEIVYMLMKALFGLKQTPRAWYQRIDDLFHQLGLHCMHSDSNLSLFIERGLIVIIIVFVNDLIFTSSHMVWIQFVMDTLKHKFEMLDFFLRFEI